MEALIDTCIRESLQMHNVLHGFRSRRAMGMDIMELNPAQELASIDQSPLFLVFLDLRKAYDTVDQERLIITLEGHGAGPCLCGLLETFWGHQQVMPRHNGFHGPEFPVTRGTTQVRLVSPALFNVLVDNVIRTCIAMTVKDQRVACDGL